MRSELKKVILLGARFSTNNMGIRALVSGAVTAVWKVYPNARIYLFDYHPISEFARVQHPGGTGVVRLLNIRFSKKFWLPNNIARLLLTVLILKIFPLKSLRDRMINQNLWLRHLVTADFIGSIAGGDSFSDIYSIERLIYIALPQILVLLLGKPLVLLPQTIGPFNSILAKKISRFILERAQKIYARDHISLTTIKKKFCLDNSRLAFCYDMGFILKAKIDRSKMPPWLEEVDHSRPVIGLNISGLLYIGGYTKNNMFGLKSDYRAVIYQLIKYLIRKNNTSIILVPHVLGHGQSSESDVTACLEVLRETEKEFRKFLHIVENNYNQHELKAIIGQCDFFLGSRMHACIAALSQGIPVVALAYTRKFIGVFQSLGLENLVVDLRRYDEDSVIAVVDKIYERRHEIRRHLDTIMPSVEKKIMEIFVTTVIRDK